MDIVIDASNVRGGGGVTYLSNMLGEADPVSAGISRITVWSGDETLDHLPERSWLRRETHPWLNGGLLDRLRWQRRELPRALRAASVLYAPSGTYVGSFRPFVAISRNMLPFQPEEARRYGVSWQRLRLLLLRHAQTRTFRNAAAAIFLTEFARDTIEHVTGPLSGRIEIIPHGVAEMFRAEARTTPAPSATHPLRWLYVSTVNMYKHQWNVVEAAARLRQEGIPVELTLVGDGYGPAMRRLDEAMRAADPTGVFVRYVSSMPRAELAAAYHSAGAFVFASTCENMPNTLVEAMASGLPIVCSDKEPMRGILRDAGVYCDVESVDDLAAAMRRVSLDGPLRDRLAKRAARLADGFSWARCAARTIGLLADTAAQGPNATTVAVPKRTSGVRS